MKKAALLLLLSSSVFAQQHPHAEIFPSDFTPSPCASKEPCISFTNVSFEQAAHAFFNRDLDPKWSDKYGDQLEATTKPFCVKRATCNASPGRLWWFCNDVFALALRGTCETIFDPKTRPDDNRQCHTWMDTYVSGVDQHGSKDWAAAQKCLKESGVEPSGPHHMDWWSSPATVPAGYKGPIRIFAVDSETHVPVEAEISFEDQIVYATDPPTGKPTTYYVFNWPRILIRVPNADGHSDVRPVSMSITAPGYETVHTLPPTELPKMITSMKRDAHSLTITATDSDTGKPVEAQVYLGEQTVGFTNQPIELAIGKKHPELWVRSPFDAYSDVVLLKAQ